MSLADRNIINRLLAYLKNLLPNNERHQFEKEAQSDPFLQDALDGFSRLNPEELEEDFALLNQQLSEKINKRKKRSLIPLLRIAAGFIILAGIGSLIIFTTIDFSQKEMALKLDESTAKEEIPSPIEEQVHQLMSRKKETQKEKTTRPHEIELKTVEDADKSAIATNKKEKSDIIQMQDSQLIAAKPKAEIEILAKAVDNDIEPLKAVAPGVKTEVESLALEEESAEEEIQVFASQMAGSKHVRVISGKVMDADVQSPIPGVSVIVNGTNQGVITDFDGKFQLENPQDSLLTIAYVGMEEQTININNLPDSGLEINLEPSTLALDEVVVTGYGRKKLFSKRKKRAAARETVQAPMDLKISGVTIDDHDYQIIKLVVYEDSIDYHTHPKGGFESLDRYLSQNNDIQPGTTVKIGFTVEKNGILQNFSNFNLINEDQFQMVVQLIKEGPLWEPAKISGTFSIEQVELVLEF